MVLLSSALFWIEPYIRVGLDEMVLLSSALYWIKPYIRVGLDEMYLLASALYWIEPYIRVVWTRWFYFQVPCIGLNRTYEWVWFVHEY